MTLQTITPDQAKHLMDQGAILIDIREADEHARERVPGAYHLALSALEDADLAAHRGKTLIFHCRSGMRTRSNAARLTGKLDSACEAFIVEGGFDAWRAAGLPVVKDRRQPIEMERQVRIAAGGLTLAGSLLGLAIDPWFIAVPLLVGAGLMFAGISGTCGMARILAYAPWNRTAV